MTGTLERGAHVWVHSGPLTSVEHYEHAWVLAQAEDGVKVMLHDYEISFLFNGEFTPSGDVDRVMAGTL